MKFSLPARFRASEKLFTFQFYDAIESPSTVPIDYAAKVVHRQLYCQTLELNEARTLRRFTPELFHRLFK